MEGIKDLIVDDDQDITDSLRAIPEDQRFNVATAGDPAWLPVDAEVLVAEVEKLLVKA